MTELRHLAGQLGGLLRSAMYNDQEYVVVPVVALVSGVIHAINSPQAEFVPVTTLSAKPERWNGRPVVLGHPMKDGRQCSAASPEVLAQHGFGHVSEARVRDGKLLCEAWINPSRVEALGATPMLDRLRNGEMVEVSVGAFVSTLASAGAHNGKAYKAEWAEIVPDHLAFLPRGVGACSIAMGCGAHRAAQASPEGDSMDEEIDLDALDLDALGLEALGGPGSGWHREQGHVAKSQGEDKPHADAAKAQGAAAKMASRASARLESYSGLSIKDPIRAKVIEASQAAHAATVAAGTKGSYLETSSTALKAAKDGDFAKAAKLHDTMSDIHSKASTLGKRMSGTETQTTVMDLKTTPTKMGEKEYRQHAADLKAKGFTETRHYQERGQNWTNHDKVSPKGTTRVQVQHEIDANYKRTGQHSVGQPYKVGSLLKGAEGMKSQSLRERLLALFTSAAKTLEEPEPDEVVEVASPKIDDDEDEVLEARSAAGARNSSSDLQMIQGVHDHSVKLGATCSAMNIKALEPAVADATVAEVTLTAAEAAEEAHVTNEERAAKIKALTECPCSGFTAADIKALEGFSDDRLVALAATGVARKKLEDELKTAKERIAEIETSLKAAEAAQIPSEELTSLRALAAERKVENDKEHDELVVSLKAASSVLTEEQLKAKSLDELKVLAQFARVSVPDYSGRGTSRTPQSSTDSFTPPNSYEAGIKALQSAKVN
jgi:hypothetical protein